MLSRVDLWQKIMPCAEPIKNRAEENGEKGVDKWHAIRV